MSNPRILWRNISGKECLYFEFSENLREADAAAAVKQWKAMASGKSGSGYFIVWNCLKMSGYDKQSRQIWQDALLELYKRSEPIWLITTSILVEIGANVLSTFTRYKIKVVSAEDKIKF